MTPPQPAPPSPILPEPTWEHIELYEHVKEAISSLPGHFTTETYIEGILATDIFTLNSALSATIEEQVVATLNKMRNIWDPNDHYSLYHFVRQAQTFPDVLLRRNPQEQVSTSEENEKRKAEQAFDDDTDRLHEEILLGIELKGWYLLSKEGEPSFRYKVTPEACTQQDLIVVIPWVLKNVITGSPYVLSPYIISAKYAALYRNYHWQYLREAESDSKIVSPQGVTPYPKGREKISDKPQFDSGGNFGRYARTGLMDNYIGSIMEEPLCGIAAKYWLDFFKMFVETKNIQNIKDKLERLRGMVEIQAETDTPIIVSIQQILSGVERIIESMG